MAKNKNTGPKLEITNKPVLQFSVLCDGVAKGPGNKPVLIGVFNNLVRTGVIPQFFIVNRWIYGTGTFKQKIAIKDPDLTKSVAEVANQEFVLRDETTPVDLLSGFVNVNFEKSGVYWVEVSIDNEVVLSYPLPVFEEKK